MGTGRGRRNREDSKVEEVGEKHWGSTGWGGETTDKRGGRGGGSNTEGGVGKKCNGCESNMEWVAEKHVGEKATG